MCTKRKLLVNSDFQAKSNSSTEKLHKSQSYLLIATQKHVDHVLSHRKPFPQVLICPALYPYTVDWNTQQSMTQCMLSHAILAFAARSRRRTRGRPERCRIVCSAGSSEVIWIGTTCILLQNTTWSTHANTMHNKCNPHNMLKMHNYAIPLDYA